MNQIQNLTTMPNHVQNRLTFSGAAHDVQALRDAIATTADDGTPITIDFNRIIPMPKILKDHMPHTGVIEAARFAMGVTTINDLSVVHGNAGEAFKNGDWGKAANVLGQHAMLRFLREVPYPKDYSDQEFEEFMNCCRAIKETGFTYWYDFALKMWGTKWNAYEVLDKRDTLTRIHFQTAWSTPFPVVLELSRKHPQVEIRLEWSDEDSGCNCGNVLLKNGEVLDGDELVNNSEEAWKMYFELHPGSEADYHLVDGKYEYKEEV